MLEAVFSLAFYVFLRSGEFTTPSLSFNPDRDITFSDLAFHLNHFTLCLKHSKCGGVCSVIMARISSSFCSFQSVIRYTQIRPHASPLSPLFLIRGNLPLSNPWFNYHLKQVLIKRKLSPQQYSGCSFRIGAATPAANQSISSASLQQLECWSSSAYAPYICPDISTIIANQRSLKP